MAFLSSITAVTNHPTRSNGAPARRVVVLAAALVLASAGAAWAQTQPAGSGKIGVATLGPAGLPADLRIKLEDAAAAGLRASGAEVVSGTELSRARAAAALGACTDAVCEQRLAQITDTQYWLHGTVVLDTSTYRIHLELTDARSGASLGARDDTCDICTEAEAAETVNVAASALKAKVTPKLNSGVALAAPAPPAPSDSAGATTTTDGTAPAPAADSGTSGRPTWLRVLPWVAFAGAAVALGAGTYYWSVDGDGVKCPVDATAPNCPEYKDRRPEMFISFGVGAALAATGVVLLVLPTPTPTTVGFSGRGVTLSGRF